MLRGLPIVSPLFRKSLFKGGVKPPLADTIDRRFRTRTGSILNDEIAGRNATLLAPVSAFNGFDSSVSIPKNIDEHLFPYVDEEYKLYCTNEDTIAKVQGKGNCEKLLMKELGGVLMIDASISREAKFIVSGVSGKVVKYLWGDGNYTKVTHSGLDIVISYTYKTDDVYYFLWDSDEFNKLQITSSKDALEGNISSLANLTYIASFGNCNKLEGNLSSLANLTYYASFDNCTKLQGNLSSLANLTYYASFGNCNKLEGNISSLANLTYIARFYNCTKLQGNLSSLANLTYIASFGNCNKLEGNISSLANLTYIARFYNCTKLQGNISSLANLTYIASFSYCNKLTVNSDFTFNVTQAYFSGCDFSTIEIERLVRALDNNNKNNGILAITGINAVPNADTLLLITSLKSKGWTVTHN